MIIASPTWDIPDDLISKGEKNNVAKWNDILNQDITKLALEMVKIDIFNMEYVGNDAMAHALKNAERQGAIKTLRKIYDLGVRPKMANQELPDPWEHVQPDEEGVL